MGVIAIGLLKIYAPLVISFLALMLSAWGFKYSRKSAIWTEYQKKTYKEIHHTNILKKAETIFLSLVYMESASDPINLKNVYFTHGIDMNDWPYFAKDERMKIIEAWETLDKYLSTFWLNDNGELKTLRQLSLVDIEKISLDRISENGMLHRAILAFDNLTHTLRFGT